MERATRWLPCVLRLCLPDRARRLVLNSAYRSEASAEFSFRVSIMEGDWETRFLLQDIDMQISPSSADPRKGSRAPFFVSA
jgi:hypothetical protein